MEASITEPASLTGQFLQPLTNWRVIRSFGDVAVGLRLKTDQRTGAAMRVVLVIHRPVYGQFSRSGRQKFFDSISFRVAASSMDSANNFFSRRFSSSKALLNGTDSNL